MSELFRDDASMPGNGVSEMEVRNILLRVFDPTEDTTHKFIAAPQEKGALGVLAHDISTKG